MNSVALIAALAALGSPTAKKLQSLHCSAPLTLGAALERAGECTSETGWAEPVSGGYRAVCGDADGVELP